MANNTTPLAFLLSTIFLLLLSGVSSGRLISDGVHDGSLAPPLLLRLNNPFRSSDTCDQTYDFLPCTTTVLGNLFLIIVYGYLMFFAAMNLSNGSELLLAILGPGIVGGLLLPILGALPDAMLILVSGLSGTTENCSKSGLSWNGLLAGSTVMLLTVIWGTCVVVGKCDLQDSIRHVHRRVYTNQTPPPHFLKQQHAPNPNQYTDFTDDLCVPSDVIAELEWLSDFVDDSLWFTNNFLDESFAGTVNLSPETSFQSSPVYVIMIQVFQPWIQRRKLAYAKHKHIISGILRHLKKSALGRLLADDGTPNKEVIDKLFKKIDVSGDGQISATEMRALIIGIQFNDFNVDVDDAVDKVMNDFDTSLDSKNVPSVESKIDQLEFFVGISKWLNEAKCTGASSVQAGPHTINYLDNFHQQTKKEHDVLGDHSDEIVEGVENPKWTTFKAVLLLLLGTVIAAAFADPLVDAVDNFSDATSIPSFFISFIALPLATNSSESVTAIIFSSRKRQRSASLTFSELYGAATMNNLLCLSVFLALVYIRGLTWDFSAEVLVILIVCIMMGVFGSFRTTFPLWTSFVAFLLYPFSLALVYVLDYVLGWS
ncbi:sodium/calcium exchanger NCL1-like [Camellia sinensis]|uniref:sodium/calcium exchanger NCL1-like n=1 Tax=Camellia sinensis TaxID=4442 RepID=UPI00103575E3|nr:sodium/calcium exchanger NCL1-like [Camellia sinensis]